MTWAQIVLKILSLFESLFPALMVAWNGHLRHKTDRLRVEIAAAKAEAVATREEAAVEARYVHLARRERLDKLLARGRPGAKP